jgi:hypothetical protein
MRLKDRVFTKRFWKRFFLLGKTGNLFGMRLKDRVFMRSFWRRFSLLGKTGHLF